ncbi:hypothetical protein [Arenimonas sp. MALMAid1274]|uniref:hypothetical protein n=1 Tax=Arenimonas sp. MALMAid1274 TaxID=3411630 RepID=UPI003B9FA3DD
MSNTARKLLLWIAVFVLSFPLLNLSGWFGVGIPLGLVLSILYWFDLAQELRNNPNPSRRVRVASVLMGVPQAMFGLVCAGIGVAIVAWVLYNTFVERQPSYSGGFLTLGIGPALILFGLGWLATAFHRNTNGPDEA